MSGYAEPQIARLLSAFRSPPDAWVRAAQELPLVRRGFDDLLRYVEESGAKRVYTVHGGTKFDPYRSLFQRTWAG